MQIRLKYIAQKKMDEIIYAIETEKVEKINEDEVQDQINKGMAERESENKGRMKKYCNIWNK